MHTAVCFQTLPSPTSLIEQHFVHKLIPAYIAYRLSADIKKLIDHCDWQL